MDNRLADLLRNVVDEYVTTAEPVGSQRLVEQYGLDVSPATVRNWFAELDELGLLAQPHTSGGRIPTEKGFRAYLERFVERKPAGKRERQVLAKAVKGAADGERRVKQTARAIADESGLAVVVGLNRADTFYTGISQLFAQPEFKDWQRVVTLTELLDRLDETLQSLRRERWDGPRILLGSECPFGPVCGAVLGSVENVVVGILGPLRMDYQRGLSLIISASEVLKHEL